MRWPQVFLSDRGRCQKALPVLCCVAMLSACGGHGEGQVKSPIVALVNDKPITVSQLNQVMRADPVARGQAIESLVNEELLVQGAEKQQLDQDPAVVQAVEASRRQILARTFAERNLYPKEDVSSKEAHEFFKANPILFEKRKRFLLRNYFLEGGGLDQQLTAALENVQSDSDLRQLLEENNITYATQIDLISADHLPLDKLSDFEHASVGDVMMAHQGSGKAMLMLMLITDIQDDAPLSFDRAKPYIEAFLSNMRNRQALNDYLSRAKTGARIVYADDVPPGPVGTVEHERGFSPVAKADEVMQ